MKSKFNRFLVTSITSVIITLTASAADIYKINNTDNLNLATSWSTTSGAQTPNPTLGSADNWYFNEVTMLGDKTVALGGNVVIGGLALDYATSNTANNLVISSGGVLTLNGGTLGGSGVTGTGYTATGILLNRGLGGTLTINSDVALGANQSWVSGRSTGGMTLAGAVNLSTFNLSTNITAGTSAVSGPISGSGTLTKVGNGVLVLSGDNSGFSGGVTLGNGAALANVLAVGHANALGTNTFKSRGGLLSAATAGLTLSNPVDVAVGGFRLGGSNSFTLSGATTLDNNQSRTIANYSTNGSTVTLGSIVLTGTAIAAFDNGGNGIPGAPIIVSGAISDTAGGGRVTLSGSQNTTLNGANTYTGVTTLSGGRLTFNGSTVAASAWTVSGGTITGSGTVNGTYTMSGGTIALAGGGTLGSALTLNGDATFTGTPMVDFTTLPVEGNVYDVFNYTGILTTPTNLESANRGDLNDAGTKYTFTAGEVGATRTWEVTNGNWDIGITQNWVEGDFLFYASDNVIFNEPASDSVVTLVGALKPASITVNNATNSYTFSGTGTGSITGATGLAKSGNGALAIGSQQSYTGGTTVNGGTLDLTGGGGGNGTIRGTVTVSNNGVLKLSTGDATGFNSGAGSLNVINLVDSTLNVNSTANQTLGSAVITMTGSSITGIDGSNLDFFGNGSALNTLASATSSTISLPTLNLRQDNTVFTVANGLAADDLLISSVIGNGPQGNHAMIKNGLGTLKLTGLNVFVGNVTVNAGTLDLTGGGLFTSAFNNSSVVTANTGGLVKLGSFGYSGTASLGQLRDYAQQRVINGGTFEVTAGTASVGSDFTVTASGGTFRYNPAVNTNTLTLAGNGNTNIPVTGALTFRADGNIIVDEIIEGAGGSLTKTGNGALLLNAANTYNGLTKVSTGVLGGIGSLAGPLTVEAGGTLAPGASVGTFTVVGKTTLAGTYAAEINGVTSDVLAVTGDLVLGGALTVSASAPSGTEWTIATYTGALTGNFASVPAGYTVTTGGNQVKLVSTGGGGYTTWAAVNAGGGPFTGDFDNDGVENGLEYFMGAMGSSFTPSPGLVAGTVSYPRDPAATGVSFKVVTSPNLVTWTDVTGSADVSDPNFVKYTPATGLGKIFVRLEVTQP